MRVPPPGGLTAEQALAFLHPAAEHTVPATDGGRLGRYAAAMGSGANLAAIVAVADSELAEAAARIAAAYALHRPTPTGSAAPWCAADGRAWPCPTVTALTEETRP